MEIIKTKVGFKATDETVTKIVSDPAYAYPQEYGVAGWFKWEAIQKQPWHLAFRVTINDETINRNADLLGDRDLAAFVGTDAYAFSTYTYTNLNGAGNPNVF